MLNLDHFLEISAAVRTDCGTISILVCIAILYATPQRKIAADIAAMIDI